MVSKLVLTAVLSGSTPVMAASVPAVPGIPTNTGTSPAFITSIYVGAFCNKVTVTNNQGQSQTWAISTADFNASGRWALIMALYTAQLVSKNPLPIEFQSSAEPDAVANEPLSPVTYCMGGDGVTQIYPNPTTISPGSVYK